MRERESELFGEELFHVWAFDVDRLFDFDNFEDLIQSVRISHLDRVWDVTYMNRPEPCSMSSSHVLVESIHGLGS